MHYIDFIVLLIYPEADNYQQTRRTLRHRLRNEIGCQAAAHQAIKLAF